MWFQPIPLAEIKVELNQIGANEDNQGDQMPKGPNDIQPKFGPKPDMEKNIDFKKRLNASLFSLTWEMLH